MPSFAYTIRDASGAVREGVSEAENEAAVARRLQEQGYTVVSIAERKVEKQRSQGFSLARVKAADLSMFCRQFSTMVDAGVSLVRCLSVLSEQTVNPKLRRIIAEIEEDVQSGQTLSKSMGKHPNVFNSLFLGLVKAGEIGGALEDALQRLSGFLEKDMELKRKIKSAMTYPTIILVVSIVIVLGLVTFILPKFIDLFNDMDIEDMPAMTMVLINFSNFMTSKWPIMIIILVGGYLAFKGFLRTKTGIRIFDRLKLKIPVFGSLNHKVCLSRFSRTLATLLVSGVPILQALETVAGTVSNEIISDAVLEARARIREGDRIGDPLKKNKLFPPMVVQMISIGEESGALDHMLTKIAEFYEQEVDSQVASLTSAIEPVMIVGLGVMVGFIVIAMFMPLIKVMNTLSTGGTEEPGP